MLSVVRGLRQPVALHVRALSSSSPFIGNALPGVCCGGSHCAVAAGVPAAPAPADDLWRRVADAVTRGAARCGDALESLLSDNTLLAVPKRKKSYAKKRDRQFNPVNELDDKQAFYPCPKCDKGLLKLHHHLCPCDMKKVNMAHVQVKYSSFSTKPAPQAAVANPSAVEKKA